MVGILVFVLQRKNPDRLDVTVHKLHTEYCTRYKY